MASRPFRRLASRWQPSPTWRLTRRGLSQGLPTTIRSPREYPSLSLANLGDTFNVRETLFPLTSAGNGHVAGRRGVFVEKRFTGGLYGQGNLSISKTRHAGLDGVLRPGSFDYPSRLQPHDRVPPVARVGHLDARLLAVRPALYALRRGRLDRAAACGLRSGARQRAARARTTSDWMSASIGPFSSAANRCVIFGGVPRRRDQPAQLRRLPVEPAHKNTQQFSEQQGISQSSGSNGGSEPAELQRASHR